MVTVQVKVWDPFVRVFHWTLVAGFFTAYLVEPDDLEALHVWAGYLVFSLVMLRVAWGLIGSEHARFGDFVRGPARVVAYLKAMVAGRAPRYVGHNPAGGAMVIALLLVLLATTITGMVTFGAGAQGTVLGDIAAALGFVGKQGKHAVKEVHEFFANLTLFLVAAHVAGVAVDSWLHRENLVRAMFTGRKHA